MDQFNFNNFPDSNFNEVNLSWMLETMSTFKEDLESGQFVGPPGPQGPQGDPGPAGDGITEEVKQALLQLARKVAYIDDQGQTYYQDLYDALYNVTPTELVSISAAYTQIGAVYDTDSLDSLKADLVVTATYSDSSTAVIPAADYTLTGSLTVGTSTITVSYQGKTATFLVTVTAGGAELISISAVYTQSGTVYDTDSLDSLKSDLVVTATYSDSTTATVPSADYTLSGRLAEGTSTITVSYGGKTTAFDVVVTNSKYLAAYPYVFRPATDGDGTWDQTTQTGTIVSSGTATWPAILLQNLLYTYSETVQKTLRIRMNLTIGDMTEGSGSGFVIAPGLYVNQSPTNNSSNRKADATIKTITANGRYNIDETWVINFTGTNLDARYLGLSFFNNTARGCTAYISDLTIEVIEV